MRLLRHRYFAMQLPNARNKPEISPQPEASAGENNTLVARRKSYPHIRFGLGLPEKMRNFKPCDRVVEPWMVMICPIAKLA
jgi:hypothetical protein